MGTMPCASKTWLHRVGPASGGVLPLACLSRSPALSARTPIHCNFGGCHPSVSNRDGSTSTSGDAAGSGRPLTSHTVSQARTDMTRLHAFTIFVRFNPICTLSIASSTRF